MKTRNSTMEYVKANRRGSREAELENSTGWSSSNKVHKDKNAYSRKKKHKNVINDDVYFLMKHMILNI